MLKKSTKSAIVMSGIAFLSIMLTFLFWELLLGRSKTNITAVFQSTSSSDIAISIFMILIILIVFVLPGAFIIHNWSDTYFGKEGAIRWGIFGIVFGCLAEVRILIPAGALEKAFFLS